jgi:hypothetical protein
MTYILLILLNILYLFDFIGIFSITAAECQGRQARGKLVPFPTRTPFL